MHYKNSIDLNLIEYTSFIEKIILTHSRKSGSSCIVKIILSIASLMEANNGESILFVNTSDSLIADEIIVDPSTGKPDDKLAITRFI